MTKSDRKRVLAALKRWEERFTAIDNDPHAKCGDLLMASVDWLRCLAKLAHEYTDPEEVEWADENIVAASLLVISECRKLETVIRDEAKNL